MSLQRHFVVFFILVFCPFCFSRHQDELRHGYLGGYVHDKPYNYKSKIKSQLEQKPEIFDLRRLRRVGAPATSPQIVNVDDFGAKSDGRDDTEAFRKAWKEACSNNEGILVVPKNKIYHLKPITFSGPCKGYLSLKILGTIRASVDASDYEKDRKHWLVFEDIENSRVEGGGIIDGNGKKWWENSCKINKSLPCVNAPTAITFYNCKNLMVANLKIRNAQQMHLSFQKCLNVKALNLEVTSPGTSPNTDGIHVTETQNIVIKRCVIRTGDDCISIVSGSTNIRALDITCGPGHGISIGSLGSRNSGAYVSNVVVNKAVLSGTTNGMRIKTWQGGSGYAKNIKFQNVVMHNVSNPIIIDQNYCDQDEPCPEQDSAVQLSNVVYKNIEGTSASEVAIKLDCSNNFPCEGILLQDINVVEEGGGTAKASCVNAKFINRGKVSPQC